MPRGYVYVLRNKAMPGLLKVGCTERDPYARAAEISTGTGVPHPFEVVHYVRVRDAKKAEAGLHRRLGRYRVNGRREFFEIDEERARRALDRLSRGRLSRFLLVLAFPLLVFLAGTVWLAEMKGVPVERAATLTALALGLAWWFVVPRRKRSRRRT